MCDELEFMIADAAGSVSHDQSIPSGHVGTRSVQR